jgi:hypothetical protein
MRRLGTTRSRGGGRQDNADINCCSCERMPACCVGRTAPKLNSSLKARMQTVGCYG